MFTKDQLFAMIERGRTLTDLFNMVLDAPPEPPASPLLRRAALLRWFDRELFERVLAADLPDAPDWEAFIASPDVERLRGEPVRYALRDDAARAGLEAWKQQPEEARAFSAKLAAYFEPIDPLERFTHLVLADPARALEEFLRLYREADEAFDLAQCDTLIRIVRHRNGLFPSLIPQALRDALDDREQYYRSRTLFADDYWRTMAFVERPSLVRHFEEWQGDTRRWILHLYGKGGFGKTMFIRWLIARRCVREIDGRRIPVARLDSDRLDLPSLSRWPWLVLLPVARQLNVQLPGSPFLSLIHGFGDFAAVLRRPAVQGRDDSRSLLLQRLRPEAEMLASEIPALFQSGLGDSHVVIVLDTIEELLLHHRSGLQAILNQLARLRERCPGLQLLLAGRYNLADPGRLPQFMKQHCALEDRLLIEGFEPEESLHYLRDLRKVPPQTPVQAIIKKTQGNPFELALFADLAIASPGMTARDVERYPGTQYARLIERIIDRIPPEEHGVAWLLRYAVVPRQLTFEFMRDVLGPFLRKEMTRRSQLDRPNEFRGELSLYAGREVWRKHREEDLRRLWNQLSRYASDHSWVELHGDVLVLQPEVRVPMRQLLREQEIHPLLQRAAVRYFERRAAQSKKNAVSWARHMAEALYHRFHLEGTAAAEHWRRALASPQAREPAASARIAEVPLSSDFAGDDGRPVEYLEGPLVDYDLLAEAAAVQAWGLLVERLRLRSLEGDAERLEGEFNDAYRRFRSFMKRAAKPRVQELRASILEAAHLLFLERRAAAEKLLLRVIGPSRDSAALVMAEYLLGRCHYEHDPDKGDAWFAAAARRAARLAAPPLSPEWIEFRRARRLEDREELGRALECYERAWKRAAAGRTAPDYAPELLAGCCRVLCELGRWSDAARLAESPQARRLAASNPWMPYEIARIRVRLALERQNPAAALSLLPFGEDGTTRLLRGLVNRAAFRVNEAEEQFNAARDAFVREGSSTGPLEALFQKAMLFLEAAGNVHQAEETLHSIPRAQASVAADRPLLKARILAESGKPQRAAYVLREILKRTSSQRRRLRVLAYLGALGLATREEIAAFLKEVEALDLAARFPFLDAYRRQPVAQRVQYSGFRQRFGEVYPRPQRGDRDFALRAWLWGLAAPHFGLAEQAREVLLAAYRECREQPHFQRQLRAAMRRAGLLELPDRDAYLTAYRAAYSKFPELWGTALLEEAEYSLDDVPRRTAQLFEQAERLIGEYFPDHSLWVARRHEVRARLAVRAGKQREALTALLTAQRSAVESGAALKAASLAKEIEAYRNVASQSHRDADLLPPVVTLLLEKTPEGVRAQSPTKEVHTIRLEPAASGSRGFAAELVEPLAYSRESLLAHLRDSLAPLGALPGPYLEVRTSRGALASIPWEAVLPGAAYRTIYRRPIQPVPIRDTVLMLQEAVQRSGRDIIIDGIYGPQTDSLLKAFGDDPREARARLLAEHPPKEKPQVLIIQASVERQQVTKRGHSNFGVEMPAEYIRCGVEVVRLNEPEQLALVGLPGFRPTLVHLVTAFQESTRTGEVCLDFGGMESTITPSALDGWLRRISGAGLHPFVLVEAVLPPDPYDQARQALLRNAFCDELFRFGNTRGVLAAGLADPFVLRDAVRRMADAAAERRSAADLYRGLAELPLLLPPALFTLDPEIPVAW